MTLVTTRLYFGVDALRLRDATGRVLSRVQGLPPDRATIRLDALVEDFRVSAAASRAMVDQMVQSGLLQRLGPSSVEFGITDRFRQYAEARIVEPLPRARAQFLVTHIRDLAEQFNRTASSNRYEIDEVAVFGSYMSLDPGVSEVSLGVTGRRRMPRERPASGRETMPTEGKERIRSLFESQNSFVRVSFYQKLQDVPRPFSVIFRDPT
jgi:hypothetical protein